MDCHVRLVLRGHARARTTRRESCHGWRRLSLAPRWACYVPTPTTATHQHQPLLRTSIWHCNCTGTPIKLCLVSRSLPLAGANVKLWQIGRGASQATPPNHHHHHYHHPPAPPAPAPTLPLPPFSHPPRTVSPSPAYPLLARQGWTRPRRRTA
ncbi:uncharacterized protein CANTADRAFT_139989 [Suhomyces tanzawaensis NRRL Y-17324]|uniref:Uncharacterized protein n=1 Tax=Suhomyces tanzawaensis NRRL Y-17324 TaxID=984487 RepID=A0A1E4SS19_9ASCO|nr:uncharacterized protein CANTADRAFT_139989 [Suhomyces tanzawaensis NRRL Y-17324]ODV82304.1 hypothetical protein CANTADRAFT_139989 [Suhomyces tanzawaensis NRRL Y-17324]